MRAGGGKNKGSQYEREVCVALSKWVTNGEKEDVFWRSAMSGGRSTVGRKQGKSHDSQVGDISCIDPAGHRFISSFSVECKFYADLEFNGLLRGNGKLLSFWEEIKKQAYAHNKFPVLFARQNRLPSMVCFDHNGLALTGVHFRKTIFTSHRYDLCMLLASEFLSICTPFN